MKIGDNIKKIRLENNLTQRQLALKLGIPYSTLANYENNHREPNLDTIDKIAIALNTSSYDLIENSSDNMIREYFKRQLNNDLDFMISTENPYCFKLEGTINILMSIITGEIEKGLSSEQGITSEIDAIDKIQQIVDLLGEFMYLHNDKVAMDSLDEVIEYINFKYNKNSKK